MSRERERVEEEGDPGPQGNGFARSKTPTGAPLDVPRIDYVYLCSNIYGTVDADTLGNSSRPGKLSVHPMEHLERCTPVAAD